MDGDCTVIPLEELREYVASLVQLLRWDPSNATTAKSALDRSRQEDFVDALTEISALPPESIDMEIRRLLVDFGREEDGSATASAPHLDHLVAALSCRDVLLKCKAANAIGSICTSRVAGQRLLELKGDVLLPSLIKMATCKNTWAQGDAFFVLGWIVVIADEAILQRLHRLVHTATRLLHKSLAPVDAPGSSSHRRKKRHAEKDDAHDEPPHDAEASEEEANRRIYCLVFLLNLSQRDPAALTHAWEPLLNALTALLHRLTHDLSIWLNQRSASEASSASRDDSTLSDTSEWPELLRLTVTLLCSLAVHVDTAATKIRDVEVLAELQRIQRDLERDEARAVFEDADVADAHERLRALRQTVDPSHADDRASLPMDRQMDGG
ncbi:hypothetical protein PINS_up005364 [Pythium insidiosum]|nr:hypothetical protein PINS_up005364 [Pythium insidiosum]